MRSVRTGWHQQKRPPDRGATASGTQHSGRMLWKKSYIVSHRYINQLQNEGYIPSLKKTLNVLCTIVRMTNHCALLFLFVFLWYFRQRSCICMWRQQNGTARIGSSEQHHSGPYQGKVEWSRNVNRNVSITNIKL